jgi:hypothetical protein
LNNNVRDWIKEWKTFIRNFKSLFKDVYDGMKGNNSSSWNEG